MFFKSSSIKNSGFRYLIRGICPFKKQKSRLRGQRFYAHLIWRNPLQHGHKNSPTSFLVELYLFCISCATILLILQIFITKILPHRIFIVNKIKKIFPKTFDTRLSQAHTLSKIFQAQSHVSTRDQRDNVPSALKYYDH